MDRLIDTKKKSHNFLLLVVSSSFMYTNIYIYLYLSLYNKKKIFTFGKKKKRCALKFSSTMNTHVFFGQVFEFFFWLQRRKCHELCIISYLSLSIAKVEQQQQQQQLYVEYSSLLIKAPHPHPSIKPVCFCIIIMN